MSEFGSGLAAGTGSCQWVAVGNASWLVTAVQLPCDPLISGASHDHEQLDNMNFLAIKMNVLISSVYSTLQGDLYSRRLAEIA